MIDPFGQLHSQLPGLEPGRARGPHRPLEPAPRPHRDPATPGREALDPGRRPGDHVPLLEKLVGERGRDAAVMKPETASELDLQPELVTELLVSFLREEVGVAGMSTRGLLGLSGGIDSAVSAAHLCALAFGSDNVLGVLMPYRTSNFPRARTTRAWWPRTWVSPTARSTSRPWWTATSRQQEVRGPGTAGQRDGACADGGPLRPLGRVGRARHRDEQQDGDAARLFHAMGRRGPRGQSPGGPVQAPSLPARALSSVYPSPSSKSHLRPISSRVKPTRATWGSPTRTRIGCCTPWWTCACVGTS